MVDLTLKNRRPAGAAGALAAACEHEDAGVASGLASKCSMCSGYPPAHVSFASMNRESPRA